MSVARSAPKTKGSTLQATLDFLRTEKGDEIAARVLDEVGAGDRARIEGAAPTAEVPYVLAARLWRAAERVLGEADPTWAERAGAFSIGRSGVRLYGGIIRKATPLEFLTQGISLFRLYYHPGDMDVVEAETGRAVLRLVDFEPAERDTLFCRRQNGGLQRALEIAGGRDPRIRHVRCVSEGDAFCEWELRWS